MNQSIDISKILFLDIETASQHRSYDELSPTFQDLWKHKCKGILKIYDAPITDEAAATAYEDKAGIYAELG